MHFARKCTYRNIALHKCNITVYKSVEAAQLMRKCSGDETTLSREKLLLS